jgi:hypothetical protein
MADRAGFCSRNTGIFRGFRTLTTLEHLFPARIISAAEARCTGRAIETESLEQR